MFANNRLSSIIDSGKTPEQLRDAYVALIPPGYKMRVTINEFPSSSLKKYEGTDCIAALVSLKYVLGAFALRATFNFIYLGRTISSNRSRT